MGDSDGVFSGLEDLLGQWNGYSTGLVTLLALMVAFKAMTTSDPDVHPMLLARQSLPSTVRLEGQSAFYRSQATPAGMPLNSGLAIKDPEAPKWARGRDGDLRDVWRRVVIGKEGGGKGRILTVLGSENVIEHKIEDLTRQINLIGQHIAEQGGIRVAIYLPNSIELLVAIFACSFYPNLTTVLIPFDVSKDELITMLRRAAVDTVITAPGSFPLDDVAKSYPALRQLIWVVDQGSSHMDWNEVPEGMGSSVNVATWQDIINDAPATAGMELPPVDPANVPSDIISFWQSKPGQIEEMVKFSHSHIVSGISGILAGIPAKERMGPSDLFLPADALTNIYTLCVTLGALFCNASVALNSVAGSSTDIVLATQGVAPTVIVANPSTLKKSHEESFGKLNSPLAKAAHSVATKALTNDGVFATSNFLSNFSAGSRVTVGTTPGKLRMVFTAERAGASTPHLSSQTLSDLRIFLGARIFYALTAPKVAGAITQTMGYDYRLDTNGSGHFGPPITAVEIWVKDSGVHKTTDEKVQGEIWVRGPSVIGGEASTGVIGQITDDHTLAYI